MALNGNIPTTGNKVSNASSGKSDVEKRLDAELARRKQEMLDREAE